jgi:YggT family protein
VQGVTQLISTLIYIETVLILVRVALSWFPGIDPWNPLVRVLRALVDPVLRPFRRILPTFGGIDFSPVLAIIVLTWLGSFVTRLGEGFSPGGEIALLIAQIVLTIIIVFTVVVLLRVVISVFDADPFSPMVQMIRQISNPLIRPFAQVVPRSRGIDLAAVAALVSYVVLYFVARTVLRIWLNTL